MSRLVTISAHAADLHLGNELLSVEEMDEQIREYLYEPLKAMVKLDLFTILGDSTHTKLTASNAYNLLYIKWINKFYRLCRKKGAAFIIIDGTDSHEDDQTSQFLDLENNSDGVYFRIIKTFEVLENVAGLKKILCLPHKLVSEDKEIEKFFKKDEYDMVLGHGTIDSMKFFNQVSENQPTKDYCYNTADLLNICKGPIYFGHIHPHTRFRRFTYVGSFTLLERGHEGPHGFMICAQSRENPAAYKDFLFPNMRSKVFINIAISKNQLHELQIEELISLIEAKLKTAGKYDLVSIALMSEGDKFSGDKILIIKEAYKKDKRISITIKVKSKKLEEAEANNFALKEKYGYLLDPNLKASQIIFKFLEDDVLPNITIPDGIEITEDILERAIS